LTGAPADLVARPYGWALFMAWQINIGAHS
jgi:hypothetical protein